MNARDDRLTVVSRCMLCEAGEEFFCFITDKGNKFSGENVIGCRNCGLLFLNPRLNPAAVNDYYLDDSFSLDFRGERTLGEERLAFLSQRATRRWLALKDFIPAKARCLEIGCSAGIFLEMLNTAGCYTLGIDPSTGYVESAQKRGLNVINGVFPADMPDQESTFDIIALFHVIEHVSDPLALLDSIKNFLAPEGLLFLEYPDISLALERREKLSPIYFQKAHLYDFTRDTISLLLYKAGFFLQKMFDEPKEGSDDKNVLLIASSKRPTKDSSPERLLAIDDFYHLLETKLVQ